MCALMIFDIVISDDTISLRNGKNWPIFKLDGGWTDESSPSVINIKKSYVVEATERSESQPLEVNTSVWEKALDKKLHF